MRRASQGHADPDDLEGSSAHPTLFCVLGCSEVVLSMNCTGDQANVYVDRPSADPVHIALPGASLARAPAFSQVTFRPSPVHSCMLTEPPCAGYFIPDGEQAKYNAKKRRFTIR